MKTLAYDNKQSQLYSLEKPAPLVFVVPTWMGINAFIQQKAHEITQLGYHALVVDMFGDGKCVDTPEEARGLIQPFMERPETLRAPLTRALEEARKLSQVTNVGIVGFCFGGTAVIELVKGGAKLAGAVAFHATIGNFLDVVQTPAPFVQTLPTPLLLLQGSRDPMSPRSEVQALTDELDARHSDWQLITYGGAQHAFTNPQANAPAQGLQYDQKTHARSWQAMAGFFQETFNTPFSESSSPSA